MSRDVLSAVWSRRELDTVEREHPELIVERDGNLLVALEGGPLAYAFHNEREFVELFPPMFEELLPRIRKAPGADTVRFRLTHAPSRPVIEPVLKRLWFVAEKAWLWFSLAKKVPLPKLVPIKGVKFRAGGIDDLADIVRLDREAFPDTPMPADVIRKRIEQGERVLLATAGGAVAGCALFERIDGGDGYLWALMVAEAHRGRGIGAALTVRASKALFAEGAETMTLRTEEDNAAAIRLYTALGFRQTMAGRDYTRPTDPRAITRIKQTSRGTLIRFGGWR